MDKDYTYIIGGRHSCELKHGFYVRSFLEICEERKNLRRIYKNLMTIKRYKWLYRNFYKCLDKENPSEDEMFNSQYVKDKGYLVRYEMEPFDSGRKALVISKFGYCLGMIDEKYLNARIHSVSEELAFLNANIKKLRPMFREYKKSKGVNKVDINNEI